MKNIYYFKKISKIGGIETFFYELAKKYKEWDLTFIYTQADEQQLKRLKQYVKCIKDDGKRVYECEKAFFNFNLDIIERVISKEKILVVHGNYHMLNEAHCPKHELITRVIAVSEDSAKAYTEITGIPCGVCYNPLTMEKPNKVLKICCASRLKDKVKGGERIKEFVKHLDRYCEINDKKYLLLMFTDDTNAIKSENVAYLSPRLDVRDYVAECDYLLQLSDNFEGFNYSVNESLMLNTPVVITDCNVYKELGIDETMSIRLNFDLSNVDDVIEQMFKKKFVFSYKPPKDNWDNMLVKGKSTYEGLKYYLVKTTNIYKKYNVFDSALKCVPKENIECVVDGDRLEILLNWRDGALVEVIKEIGKSQENI